MTRHAKTERIIQEAHTILAAYHPMTVRQVYYQLVSRQVVENNRGQYQAVSDALVAARREGIIPWDWIEDRLRQVHGGGDGWRSVERYLEVQLRYLASGYGAAIWPTQPRYVECWLEKDALSGIFSDALGAYNIGLNVGRGYDGWSSIHNAGERFQRAVQDEATILYFGDFDPSGEDMVRSLRERLAECDAAPDIEKVALTLADIERYNLPPNFTKPTDSRAAAHIARFGNLSVELDALPPDVLRARIIEAVEETLDMDALRTVRRQEARNRTWLARQVANIQRAHRADTDTAGPETETGEGH
jgi:hypothetical protein